MKRLISLVMLLAVAGCDAFAQTPRIPVKFDCSCDDQTGAAFATAFRDALASSPRYIETNVAYIPGGEGKLATFNWQIRAVSIDPSSMRVGQSMALAVVILFGESFYQDEAVQFCSRDRVASCAQDVLAIFDKNAHPN